MTHASLAWRFACDGFVFPISAIVSDETALPPGCLELAVVDAGAAAGHGRASRKRQAAIHAANRTA